jgi:HK97 family phage prohead protease
MDYEVRTAEMWPEADFELRAESDGLTLEGYAAVFNQRSLPLQFPTVGGGRVFREIIRPGAFSKTLSEAPDVSLRYQHKLDQLPLARTKSGTLELSEDGHGLRAKALLPDNEWGRPVRDAIARGDISGMSFRFTAVLDKWTRAETGSERELLEVRLGPEVSITDYPAYPDTSVSVRHLAEVADEDPDELAEAFRALRDPDERLTPEQHRLLMSVIRTKVDDPFVGPNVARARERLAALA